MNPSPVRAVAAIVPAYNEAQTIGEIVNTLRACPLITEVIVVSDGSTDHTAQIAESSGARVLSFSENRGKAQAVLHAVEATSAPVLVFVDADLIGFTKEHVEQLVRPVTTGLSALSIGLRDRGVVGTWISRYMPLVSGMRALHRDLFESIPRHLLLGYQLEMVINTFARAQHIPFFLTVLSGLTVRRKIAKVGFWGAIPQYVRMWKTVFRGWFLAHKELFLHPKP